MYFRWPRCPLADSVHRKTAETIIRVNAYCLRIVPQWESRVKWESNDEIYVNVNLYCFFYQRLPTNQLISINNIIYIMIYFSPCSSFSPLNRTGNGENDGKPEQLNPLFQHFTGSEYSRPSHASRIQNKSVLIIAKIFTDCNSRAENRSWSLVALLGLLWLRSLISYEVMVLIKTLLSMPLSHMIN